MSSEEEFSEGSESESSEVELASSDDDGGGAQGTRRPVTARLPRVSAYAADAKRTWDWIVDALRAAEGRIESARVALGALEPAASVSATLHGFQLDGLRWAAALRRARLNGILADEMGLGKTLQAIALLAHVRETSGARPFLVIAPLSTLDGWRAQFAAFCPPTAVLLYTGAKAEREAARARLAGGGERVDVVLTSYEAVLADAPELSAAASDAGGWAYAVIDEAHRLKNRMSATYRCLLDEMKLGEVPRLLMTGTPLQNNAAELFAVLHFANPDIFDAADSFESWLAGAKPAETADESAEDAVGASRLWRQLILRRLKKTHLQLPRKSEVTLAVPLTSLQRQWYRAVLQRNVSALGDANGRSLVNVLAALRKARDTPEIWRREAPPDVACPRGTRA